MILGQPSAYEGYGFVTRGGAGGDIYHVTTLADSGQGSLREGILSRTGPRTIVFDVGGTITLATSLVINRPYLTIDGATAPAPGITLTKAVDSTQFVIAGTHDIILRHLRFLGLYLRGAQAGNNDTAFLAIDGDSNPDHIARNIVVDHVTVQNATDAGLDIWGEVSDVTVSWCLIANSFHPSTVSHYPAPFQTRRRISMHHNVWARNGERNPQLRADVADFDYVNNIVYDWGYGIGGGYGVRIRNDAGEPKVNGNFVNNYFLAGAVSPAWGLVYGTQPGPDADDGGPATTPAQGTVITNTALGKLWVAGNILPAANKDHYSTVPAPNPVPTNAQVTTYQALQLRDLVVPQVGTHHRSNEEQTMLSQMAASMQGAVTPPNDYWLDTITLPTLPVSIVGNNGGATTEPTEQDLANAGATVWWSFQAPANGTISIDTFGSDFNTMLHIYTGYENGFASLTPVVSNNDAQGTAQSQVAFPVNAGQFYEIRVAGYNGAQGNIRLNVGYSAPPAAVVSVAASDAMAGEPGSGQGTGVFTFTRTGSTATALTVNYTVGGTATAGGDYASIGTTVTFGVGAATAVQTVSVMDDALVEGDETVMLILGSASGYTVGSPSVATVNIKDDDSGGCTPTALVTQMTLGSLFNNYTGWQGMSIRVGANPLAVQSLGRVYLNGNVQNHELRLVAAANGVTVASAIWSPAGGIHGQIKYASLPAPVTLAANTDYYLVSQETSGGDRWGFIDGTTVQTTSAATVLSAVYANGNTWLFYGTGVLTFGPVSLQYCATSAP
jgi:hypothetical protein